jgi:hypothetical protein
MNPFGPFAHRRNPDKSIDSICTACFQTIASEDLEDELVAHEKSHSCDPYWKFTPTRSDSDYLVTGSASRPHPACSEAL